MKRGSFGTPQPRVKQNTCDGSVYSRALGGGLGSFHAPTEFPRLTRPREDNGEFIAANRARLTLAMLTRFRCGEAAASVPLRLALFPITPFRHIPLDVFGNFLHFLRHSRFQSELFL